MSFFIREKTQKEAILVKNSIPLQTQTADETKQRKDAGVVDRAALEMR